MQNAWTWMTEHWFLGFLLIYTALELAAKLTSRVLRFFMVLIRGWPKAPHMDADGDIVYPKDYLTK